MLKGIMVNLGAEKERFVTKIFRDSGVFEYIKSYSDPEKVFCGTENSSVDVVFYDPENMEGKSKFDMVEANPLVPTIIISKNPNLALMAYEYINVVDYVVFPIQAKRIRQSLNRLKKAKEYLTELSRKTDRPVRYLFVNVNRKLIRIDLANIYYLVSKGDYISLQTTKGKFTTYGTLKSFKSKLGNASFADVHRSYLVNLDHVDYIGRDCVSVGGWIVPLSRLKRKTLLNIVLCV